MHFNSNCDVIITVGSGVLSDIGKILSAFTNKPYIIIATAPSMDGYASAISSMVRNGMKISMPSRCPDVIIGDIDVLKNAPMPMLQAGLGDMVAKYVSLCEWHIAHLIVGEYYCSQIVSLVRNALNHCITNAKNLVCREPEAVQAVFEGLAITGIAMEFAGMSRPASGVEHYFSHIWDMRGLAFNLPTQLHGLQCAVGTIMALKGYEKLKTFTPNRNKALLEVASFNFDTWSQSLMEFVGPGAQAMCRAEALEGKYDKVKHAARLERIIDLWPQLLAIMEAELPSSYMIKPLLTSINVPVDLPGIGMSQSLAPITFKTTKDIRDKYVLSRLAWDLGVLEEVADALVC
jgi:glycerol-1-phosphate dehydrogenase [NAD(P)+]